MKTKMQQLWTRIGVALGLAWLALAANAQTVTTIGGGFVTPPYSGYNSTDTNTITARFNQPSGLAMDTAGNYLFVADYSNNVVRVVTSPGKSDSLTKTFFNPSPAYSNITAGISRPVSVWVNGTTNLYVLNQGGGTDGSLLKFTFTPSDGLPTSVATNATHLTNATALAMQGSTNFYVTVQSNTVLRIALPNTVTVVGVITNFGVSLDGIAVLDNGKLALSDAGTNSGLWLMNPSATNLSNNVSILAGFNGTGDDFYPSPDSWPKTAQFAHFNHPATLAKAANGILVVADSGNNRVKLVDTVAGTVSLLYGVNSNYWGNPATTTDLWPGWIDGASGTLAGYAESRLPNGVVVAPDGSVFASEDYYHILRHVTATGLSAPTGSSSSTNGTSITNYPPAFNSPQGIGLDPAANNLYVADPTNNTVWRLTFPNSTTAFLSATDGVTNPVAVLVDRTPIDPNLSDYYYVYVLNQNAGNNASILQFDTDGNAFGPLTTGLNQPTAFTQDGNGNLFVAEQSGAIKVIFPATGIANTIATITNANRQLQGIAILDNGNLAVSDAGNHVIWTVNPLTNYYSRLTGQIGSPGTALGTNRVAKLNQPHQLARSGTQLLVADYGNSRLVLVTPTGTTLTNGLNPSAASLWFGNPNDPVTGTNAAVYPMNFPAGLAVSAAGVLYASEPANQAIRSLTATVALPTAVPIVDLPYFISTSGMAPAGIAYDGYGQNYGPYGSQNLFIADPTNNAVRVLNLNNNVTATYLAASLNDGITNPVAVLVDTNENVYVLNAGANGYISTYDIYGNPLGTNCTGLNHPTDFTLDGYGNYYITEQAGTIRYFGAGVSNTLVTITNANVSLQGIALFDDGSLAVSDTANQVIWSINAITKNVSRLTGQLGQSGTNFGSAAFAKLSQPRHLARAGNNQIIIADYGNNRLVTLSRDGTITHALNATNASVWFGQSGDPVTGGRPQFIPMLQPTGVAVGNGLVYASETYYGDIRGIINTGVITPASNPGVPLPVFADPGGIVLNMLGTTLFIADSTNNTIWSLNLNNNQTTAFLNSSNGLIAPVDMAMDSYDNLYILNRGDGNNGFVFEFDKYGNLLATNATGLTQATAIKCNSTGDIFVTELGGKVKKFNAGSSNVIATINPNLDVQLQGITLLDNGTLVVSDSGNHVLWKINPNATNAFYGSSTNIAVFTGLLGKPGATLGDTSHARLNTPLRISGAYGGFMAVVDSGNNRVVLADDLGNVTTVLNSENATLWFGQPIDAVATNSPYFVPMRSPSGIAIGNGGTVFVSEATYKDIRGIMNTGLQPLPPAPPPPLNLVANSPSPGLVNLTWQSSLAATNYYINRSTASGGPYSKIGSSSSTAYNDINVVNGTTYYYVIAAVGVGGIGLNSAEATVTVLQPPVPDPQIGYVDFPATSTPDPYTSVFHALPSSASIFNNDINLVIAGTTGSETFYNYSIGTNIPSQNMITPSDYHNGLTDIQSLIPYKINNQLTDLSDITIRAFGTQTGHPQSSTVEARLQFVTGKPSIIGNNAAQFYVNDITDDCDLYYTIDGSIPSITNPATIHLQPVGSRSNSWTIGFPIAVDTTFNVVATKNKYQPATNTFVFSTSNYLANTISFGFGNGEASSVFNGSAGQTFYAPVTLNLATKSLIYSLQFNLTATNYGINPGPSINPGDFYFTSCLLEKIPNSSPVSYWVIPPAMPENPTNNYNLLPTNQPVEFGLDTNFLSVIFTNNSINLLGVGWIERKIGTNLYGATVQDLIAYSRAHDNVFSEGDGKIILGRYGFKIPPTATNGQTYQIQIGRPTATSDGVGTPNSDVFIFTPTNGSTAGGSQNALKIVTVQPSKYLVGSVYPFRWFNGGDFGSNILVNADVQQVFEAVVDPLKYSPMTQAPGSDFADAMDSCGGTYIDLGHGYLEFNNVSSGAAVLNPLFDGNDSTINQIAFGDGVLDICDIYVTFRRALDPSLTWFRRYWNNGLRVAEIANNIAAHALKSPAKPKVVQPKITSTNTTPPKVIFAASDVQGTAGQTVQIPISVTILGPYPLRVLMLNLTVIPLDGSPALTTPVQFSQTATLLQTPALSASKGNGNYSAAWLDSGNAGLTGTATIGTLTVTIPAEATGNAAYAVHFDHASASPNGLATFPGQTLTGLITLASRTNSTYNDGIPDTWRLRWFGTTNNLLSASNACPTSDGINNWMKFVAGVNPGVPNNFPALNPKSPAPSSTTRALHWPTIGGKKYVVERSSSLFPGNWSVLTTNTGTGTDMEFDDNTKAGTWFYRVEILSQ